MAISHFEDQWTIDDEMMMIDGVLKFGVRVVLIWDRIDGLWNWTKEERCQNFEFENICVPD